MSVKVHDTLPHNTTSVGHMWCHLERAGCCVDMHCKSGGAGLCVMYHKANYVSVGHTRARNMTPSNTL